MISIDMLKAFYLQQLYTGLLALVQLYMENKTYWKLKSRPNFDDYINRQFMMQDLQEELKYLCVR